MGSEDAAQLQHELQDSIWQSFEHPTPKLTHLNADSTWLITTPRPKHDSVSGRIYYNILIDPWLQGFQVDGVSWFSKQWHAIEPAFKDLHELNAALREAEAKAKAEDAVQSSNGGIKVEPLEYKPVSSFIDLVIVSHEFTDHCHRETLLQLDPSTPVIAAQKAANAINSWRYFDNVRVMPMFSVASSDWRNTSAAFLPPWLGVSRLVTGWDPLYLHAAVLIAFGSAEENWVEGSQYGAAQAIIYSPHGILAQDLYQVKDAKPALETKALLHGLHDIDIGNAIQINRGAVNGLKAQRILNAKYWITTHDEVKVG